MAYDAHLNFAYSTVATAPSPATSGTSLVVQSGDGAKFPTPPFNATIWPIHANPTTADAEIVRVTNISTDTLTITRTQESTSARSVVIGDQIAASITAKTLTDIEGTAPNGAWNSYSATITGFSGTPTQTCRYIQFGKLVIFQYDVNGTSNSTSFLISLPVTVLASTNYESNTGLNTDNGSLQAVPARTFISDVNTMGIGRIAGTQGWTASGSKAARGIFIYEAA